MKKNTSIFFTIFFVLILIGCKEKPDKIASFSFETGLESDIGSCLVDEPSSLEIKELGKVQIVNLIWDFPCDSEIDKPYLTVTRKRGATLVINSDYGRRPCSCTKKVAVKINDRLDVGDTIYVVANKEVVGHKLLTAP